MLIVLAAFVIGAIVAPMVMRLGRRGYMYLSLLPALSFGYLLTLGPAVMGGDFPGGRLAWVPQLNLVLTFRIDHLAWVMSLIVTGVGTAVLFYCARYFSASAQGMGRFAGIFMAFAGAMAGLVTTDNTLALYLFWELTSVFSFLLIGFNYDKRSSRRAAMQAFIVTTAGGLAMLVGIMVLGVIPGGSFTISELVASAQAGQLGVAAIAAESTPSVVVSTAVALVLVGAMAKSAIVPFHFWLPAAMAAPTPTSAYLHAAAMVKAGVYLVARLAPGFSDQPVWRYMIVAGGVGTMLIGGYRALKQYDLKLVLAFGTVSQLGLIMLMVGYGTPAMLLAGLGMLVAHAMFKSTLFLAVGQVDWATGTRDLRQLSGVGRKIPMTAAAAAVAGMSMAGLPGFAGFVAKEAALHALIGGDLLATATWVAIAAGSVLTVAYTLRFWWGAFAAKPGIEETEVSRRSWIMTGPVLVLASGSLVFGLGAHLLDAVFAPHARQIQGEPGHLVAWPGLGFPFVVTLVILTLGFGLFVGRARVEPLTSREFPVAAETAYHRIIIGLDSLSGRATALTQRGSLPAYLSTIFTFTALAVLAAVALGDWTPRLPVRPYDSVAQAVVAVLTILTALLAAGARQRLKAVLLMGISGYGVALIYELYGAPDLALTQALVDTMTLVVFILVLRRLPQYFSHRPLRGSRWWRLAVAAGFGAMTALLGVVAAGARVHAPIAIDFHDEAYVYGYGKNIVNVTLVDIRAWDTFGEISVVVACAIGISSLLFIRDRGGRIDRFRNLRTPATSVAGQIVRPTRDLGGPTWRRVRARAIESSVTAPGRNRRWLEGSDQLPFWRRSVIVEVGTRLIFHTILAVSLFFLFAGHNAPGGGFAGGLLAGIALVLRYVAGGRYELGAAVPLHPGHLMGTGLSIAGLAALIPVALGGTILQSAKIEFVMWGFGEVKIATAIFFDIGVYLVVVGLVLDILRSLGAEIDRHGELEGVEDEEVEIRPSADSRREMTDAEQARDFDDVVSAPPTLHAGSEPGTRQEPQASPSRPGEVDPKTGLTTVATDPATTSTLIGITEEADK
ncbi:Na+/H+ antiporter subunit A [Trueperella pecoris]|uniref:Na+/H+ antiporter subunit A n=1 Tax=Trueperella pecoris TaxID=2733571 RepID=A0A7M1QUL0_9ACTO|nr:Na+/H+ antiporter subunit A [Trueperella pecoris]QOR45832.1 Na+/H+ antiporter subunit A [Trueperella pecoris]